MPSRSALRGVHLAAGSLTTAAGLAPTTSRNASSPVHGPHLLDVRGFAGGFHSVEPPFAPVFLRIRLESLHEREAAGARPEILHSLRLTCRLLFRPSHDRPPAFLLGGPPTSGGSGMSARRPPCRSFVLRACDMGAERMERERLTLLPQRHELHHPLGVRPVEPVPTQ